MVHPWLIGQDFVQIFLLPSLSNSQHPPSICFSEVMLRISDHVCEIILLELKCFLKGLKCKN